MDLTQNTYARQKYNGTIFSLSYVEKHIISVYNQHTIQYNDVKIRIILSLFHI